VSSRSFIFLAAARHPGGAEPVVRLGITASRRVGSAAVRSRIKRRVREWFRRHRAELPAGRDVVVIARAAAAGGSQIEIDRELSEDAGRLRALLEGSAPA
jgi:ribonuclease P protein component